MSMSKQKALAPTPAVIMEEEQQVQLFQVLPGMRDFTGEAGEVLESRLFPESFTSYSVSFWLSITQSSRGRPVCLLARGTSQDDLQPAIYLVNGTLVAKFTSDRGGVQDLFASKPTPVNEWTLISLVCDASADIIEASLYLNGKLSSQIAVRGSLPHGKSPMYVGKDPWTNGLRGAIAEAIVFYSPVSAAHWQQIHSLCIQNYSISGRFDTLESVKESALRDEIEQEKLQLPLVAGLHPSLSDAKMGQTTARNKWARLEAYLDQNKLIAEHVEALAQNYNWLMPIFMILRETYPTIEERKLEVDRMLPPLGQVKIFLTREDLIALAKVTRSHESIEYADKNTAWASKETDDLIDFVTMLNKISDFFYTDGRSDFNSEQLEDSLAPYIKTTQAFIESRNADFEICIDHCVRCDQHQTTTWHDEREYIQMFNKLYAKIQEELSNTTIYGNKHGAPSLAVFSVYLEGVGAVKRRDTNDRFYVFRKHATGNFYREVLDAIYLLGYCYGNLTKLAEHQAESFKLKPPPEPHDDSHTNALSMPEEVKRIKINKETGEKEYEPDTLMCCLNWTCGKQYKFGKNKKNCCRYHPGRWEFGSIHGLWPENWTCCRRVWNEPGCARGRHKGLPYNHMPRKCVNRGEINPATKQPDSICGRTFPDPASCGKKYVPDATACKYHSGYRVFRPPNIYEWSCCQAEADISGPDASYCVESEHRCVEWPEEEAKIYFVTKSVLNPGLSNVRSSSVPLFQRTAMTSRFFNPDIKPYIDPYQKKKMNEALNAEPRYCLNWACESTFKEETNTPKSCTCHTGYFDFGHSGIQTVSNKETHRIVLWEAHWRCCGGKWATPGCTKTKHRGPLLSTIPERKWKWPSEGAMRYFEKKISKHWQRKLEKEHITRAYVGKKYDQVCAEARAPKLPQSYMHRLCMTLHLHILCVSPDMGYMFKYQDVVTGAAEAYLVSPGGVIEKDSFIKWWFSPLEEIRPQMA